jgi:hypothetical protein
MEQKLTDKVANVSTLYGDPSVYCLQISSLDQSSIKNIGEVEKKRLADIVRRKSGWDDPVLVNSSNAQVGATWNAAVDDKRRLEDTPMEDSQGREKQQRPKPISTSSKQKKKKEVRFQSDEAFNQKPSQGGISQDQAKPKKTKKRGLGYLLACDVESTIEKDGLVEKFWQQEARGFTNGNLFKSLRLELQNKIFEHARRKRIY